MILGDIFRRNARRYPQKTAVVSESTRLTFREFSERTSSLGNALLGMGLQAQDRVAIILGNGHRYLELYCATVEAGCVAVPVNTSLSPSEMTYIINNAGARLLVFGGEFDNIVDTMVNELISVERLICVGSSAHRAEDYEQLIKDYHSTEPQVEVIEESLAYLMYSSGTTGMPKGIMVSHRSMIESTVNYVLGTRLGHEDIGLVASPLFWGAGLYVTVMPQFYMGGTVVVADDFSPRALLTLIKKERVTTSMLTPPLIMAMLEHPDIAKYDLSSLRHVWFSGIAMPANSLKRAINMLGNVFFQLYGMIEMTPLSMVDPEEETIEGPPERTKRLNSCGKEAPNVEIRVVNEEEKDVAPGEVGEVIGRGDNMMKGYWRMPQATEEACRGGYMHTGDLATMDEDGHLYLVGRKKDVILTDAKTVYPVEIEQVIFQHPAVAEAAVIGVPDERLGEALKAVIVLKERARVTAEDIIKFCRQWLPDYAVPKTVDFTNQLPRNPANKVLKRVLKEKYR